MTINKNEKQYVTNLSNLQTIFCPCLDEQEITVTGVRPESHIHIFVSDNVMLTKIKRAAFFSIEEGGDIRKDWKCWEGSKDPQGNITGYFFEAPKNLLSFRSSVSTQNLTDEQKAKIVERFKKGKASKTSV